MREGGVTGSNAAADHAHVLDYVTDAVSPDRAKIVPVQGNVNTRPSRHEAFPPEETLRLANRFEWRCAPKHGSWLDRTEPELAVVTNPCLDRRLPAKADWRFTTNDARVKLMRPYS